MQCYYVIICVVRVVERYRMRLIYHIFFVNVITTNSLNMANKDIPRGVYTFIFIVETSMV